MKKFHQAFCRIWEGKDEIPQEWRCSKVIPLYKNKGDPKEASNWRGLSIGSNLCKLWLICVLERARSGMGRRLAIPKMDSDKDVGAQTRRLG